MAFRSGMELSTKDGVVLLDGDLQDPPELIEQFYEQWEAGYDVVYGRRVQARDVLVLGRHVQALLPRLRGVQLRCRFRTTPATFR